MSEPTALVIGEALTDIVHEADGTVLSRPGGSPANVAVGLARLGVPTALLTRLGADLNGDALREHLEQTGSPLVASLIARLERGEDVFGRFTKLVPVDYQSVLALRARFEEDGTDPDGSEAWSSILEMTHG